MTAPEIPEEFEDEIEIVTPGPNPYAEDHDPEVDTKP